METPTDLTDPLIDTDFQVDDSGIETIEVATDIDGEAQLSGLLRAGE